MLFENNIDTSRPFLAPTLARSLTLLPTLKHLYLEGSLFNSNDTKVLATALCDNTTITSLRIGHNPIDYTGICELGGMLLLNTTITSLNIRRTLISSNSVEVIAESLMKNTTLLSLELDANPIGNSGIDSIAKMLYENSTLQFLQIRGIKIDHIGAAYLADSLTHNQGLLKLVLGLNPIGNVGANALATMLRTNSTLKSLDFGFGGCDIELPGALALAESLKQNQSLTELNLFSNNIEMAGSNALANALKFNTSLLTLSIEYSLITPKIKVYTSRNNSLLFTKYLDAIHFLKMCRFFSLNKNLDQFNLLRHSLSFTTALNSDQITYVYDLLTKEQTISPTKHVPNIKKRIQFFEQLFKCPIPWHLMCF